MKIVFRYANRSATTIDPILDIETEKSLPVPRKGETVMLDRKSYKVVLVEHKIKTRGKTAEHSVSVFLKGSKW